MKQCTITLRYNINLFSPLINLHLYFLLLIPSCSVQFIRSPSFSGELFGIKFPRIRNPFQLVSFEVDKKNDDCYTELSARMEQLIAGMEEVRTMVRDRVAEDITVYSTHSPPQGIRRNPEIRNNGSLYATIISKLDLPEFDG